LQKNTDNIPADSDNSVNTGSRILELRPKLTVIPAADDGIGWALRVCKSIIQENISRDPRVAVSALNAYFKGLEMTQTQTQEKQLDYDDSVEDLLQFFEARGIPMENLW